jgi:hypothetical protein
MYQGEDITEHNNQRKLNILKGFVEVIDIIEKGHMDFGGGKAPAGGKGNLVQKKITDKSGHNTTRWVKNGQEETGQDESNVEAEQSSEGVKTSDDHAKETQSEDLKTYIANNPDGEHVAAAQAELQARGESDDMGAQGGAEENGGSGEAVKNAIVAYGNFSENEEGIYSAISAFENEQSQENYDALVNTLRESNAYEPGDEVDEALQSANPSNGEQGASYKEDEGFSGSEGGVNYDDPNSVSQAISDNRDAIIELLTSDPSLNAITALKLHMATAGGGNAEAHGALDAAQQALDAAKTATGHPGAQSGENNAEENSTSSFSDSDIESMFNPDEPEFDVNGLDNNEMESLQNSMKAYAANPENTYAKEVSDYLSEFGDEEEEEDNGGGDSNFHNQDEKEDEDQGGGDSNFHKQDEDENSDNSKDFSGDDEESEDDKEKKKPNFGKK